MLLARKCRFPDSSAIFLHLLNSVGSMDNHDAVDRSNSVPMSVAERVINVHTTKPFDWVKENVFSEEKCGKRNILFWKSDKPGSCHFFIEFANKDSVPIAQREAGPGVTVHCLSRNMNMAYIFDCLSRGLDPPKKRVNTDPEGSQHGDPPDSSKHLNSSDIPPSAKRQRMFENEPTRRISPPPHRDGPYKPYRTPANFSQNSRDFSQRNFNSKPKPSWNTTVDNRDVNRRFQNPSNGYQKGRFRPDFRNANRSVSPSRRARDDSLYYGERDDDRASVRSRDYSPPRPSFRRNSDASMKRPSESSLRRPSDSTNTSLDIYAPTSPRVSHPSHPPVTETLNLSDLDSLNNDNIAAVIESLKTSSSGPEAWMTIAAHYRRMKLHKNALAVVDSMLEVMRERGVDKSELRPALLLMAQCHHSIANQERRDPDTLESSNRHFVLLLEWLRETYGPFTPAVDAIAQLANQNPWSSQKEGIPAPLQNPFIPGYDPLQPTAGLFDTHSSVSARLDAISEENTRLRDSQSATSADLAACRAALHEAEAAVRAAEVKLQRALEDQRLAASSALREADARRRVEDRLAQERKAFDRRMEELRDEGARAALRELNAIVTLSAKAPMSMLEATRVFCEARGRVEREIPNTA